MGEISTKTMVSVLITVYNRENYIAEAIESVLSSTFSNFELIIVDDCSSDKSYEIASSYLLKNPRIKLYQNIKNLGQFANRNKAIEFSSGTYIKFLDSDDKLMPNGLEVMLKRMLEFPDAGIGVPIIEQLKTPLPYELTPHESVGLHYRGANHLSYGPTGTIYKREAFLNVGLFEEQYGILTDTLLNIKIACLYNTVFFEQDLFYWRRHEGQVTKEQDDKLRMIRERYIILNTVINYEFLPLNKLETNLILNNFIKINALHFLKFILIGHFKDGIQVVKDTNLSFKKIFLALIA